MKPRRFRSGLITAIIIMLAGGAWLFFAPTRIGGSTTYVVTSGVSMQPRFHSGDLALVRPAGHYRVGMVVAYHSSLLKVVVLHRIVAIHGGRYTFKGDNNNFLDPVHPTRSQLVGALWLRVPHGGRILKAVHAKVTVILLCVFVGLLLVGGTEKRRRGRRRRHRSTGSSSPKPMTRLRDTASTPSLRSLLIGVGAAAAGFLVLGGYALNQPGTKTVAQAVPYSQHAIFSYHATAPRGAVYPDGKVSTGDPIFLALVHRIGIKVADHFQATAATGVRGTEQLTLNVGSPTGWSRSIPLTGVRHFKGANPTVATTLDINAVQALLLEVGKQTGLGGTSGYTLGVTLNAHVHAKVAGQPVDQDYSPALNFTLQPLQLQAAAAGAAASKKGSLATASSVSDPMHLLGHTVSYATLTWLGLLGFLICSAGLIPLAVLLRRNRAFDEAARIKARYGHLLVPILIGEDLGWPPVDVGSFKAIVRLAEAAGQVILHHQADAVDTYLVNDNGTVYRYQIQLPLVTWGDWTEANISADAGELADAATALADVAAPAQAPADVAAPAQAPADVAAPAQAPADLAL